MQGVEIGQRQIPATHWRVSEAIVKPNLEPVSQTLQPPQKMGKWVDCCCPHHQLCVELGPLRGMSSPSHLTVFTLLSLGSTLTSHCSAVPQIPSGLTHCSVTQARLSCEAAVGLLTAGFPVSWLHGQDSWTLKVHCCKCVASQRGKRFSSFPGRKQMTSHGPLSEGHKLKLLPTSSFCPSVLLFYDHSTLFTMH